MGGGGGQLGGRWEAPGSDLGVMIPNGSDGLATPSTLVPVLLNRNPPPSDEPRTNGSVRVASVLHGADGTARNPL